MNNPKIYLRTQRVYKGKPYTFELLDVDSFKGLEPITQCYAFCYTSAGKLVIGKMPDGSIGFPGGTVEAGEEPLQTLRRELDEEVTVSIQKYTFLGAQRVTELDTGKLYYQLRFACLVDLHEMTPDPDYGECWERILIEPSEFTDYFHWGSIGEYFLEKSLKWFLSRE